MALKKYFHTKRLFWGLFCVIMISLVIKRKNPAKINIINIHQSSKVNSKISYPVDNHESLVVRSNSYDTKSINNERDENILNSKDVKQVKQEGKMF